MGKLKSALLSKYAHQRDRVKIYNPRNCDELRLYFKGEKIAKVPFLESDLRLGRRIAGQ